MSKNIFTALVLFIGFCCHAQNNNGSYFNKPFAIYRSSGQLVLAGQVNTFIYSDYYGKNLEKEVNNNVHKKPEYLVYELFKKMQIKNLDAIGKLYDSSFNRTDFDLIKMAAMLKGVSDIRFRSKFSTGNRIVIRYDFVSNDKQTPYFAAIRNIGGEFYLTMDLNLSDPFNVVGSCSPYNLFDKVADPAITDSMTPFYFIEKENKIFFTNEIPEEDHTCLYLAINRYNENSKGPEIELLKRLQTIASSGDSISMKRFIHASELPMLSKPAYANYLFSNVMRMFKDHSVITPVGSVDTENGKIVYFNFSNPGQTANIASISLRKWSDKWYVSLKMTNGDINNILQNTYVREAIYDYFGSTR